MYGGYVFCFGDGVRHRGGGTRDALIGRGEVHLVLNRTTVPI